MNITIIKALWIYAQVSTVGFEITQGCRCRLFHYITEVTRQDQLALTGSSTGLDEEDIAPHPGPGQADADTGNLHFLVLVVHKFDRSQGSMDRICLQ